MAIASEGMSLTDNRSRTYRSLTHQEMPFNMSRFMPQRLVVLSRKRWHTTWLKAGWNQLAPVSSLPAEIFSTIFYFALAGRTGHSPVFPCYYFSHVSRSWRSVALNTPNLWQVLPEGIPWATAMLERSRGADLVVDKDFYLQSPNSSRVLFLKQVVANNASRIRELELSFLGAETSDWLFENLPQSSLRLRSLKLIKCHSERPSFLTGIMETDNLRILDVRGCHGPWYSLSLPALTNLKLHNIANRPSLPKFHEMLRGLATLEVLDMHDSLPLANAPGGRMDPVNLPNLHRLCLASTSDPKEIAYILSLIIIPPTATVQLIASDNLSGIQEPEILVDELASSFLTFSRHLRQSSDFSYSSLGVSSWNHGRLELKAWTDDRRMCLTPGFSLTLDQHLPSEDLLQRIFPSLPFFNITTLTLDVAVPRVLEDTFGHLSRLKNVKAIGCCAYDVLSALTRKPESDNGEPSAILFPTLQSVWIETFGCTTESLQDSFMQLRERKVRLSKVRLTGCHTGCHVSPEFLDNLREVAENVEWARDTDLSIWRITGDSEENENLEEVSIW